VQFASAFVCALRARTELTNSRILFIGERNSGHESGHIWLEIARSARTFAVCERTLDKVGWWTTNAMKIEYVEAMRDYFLERSLCFSAEGVTCVNPWIPSETRLSTARAMLADQMRRFRGHRLPSGAMTYSGKIDDRGRIIPGVNDDLALCVMMCAAVHKHILRGHVPLRTN
jgi:hypothetical protein